jgi:hypothetical protein
MPPVTAVMNKAFAVRRTFKIHLLVGTRDVQLDATRAAGFI